ncbi:MAG: hypothetical protein EHM40_18380 [Chloroflexi bacterium]|nr:MAG: hypothetical protein EHM40_18380 [Chloroflexota bacterium]
MPKIEFRGKFYNNEFEMPPEERKAYNREKDSRAEKNKTGSKSLSDIVEMSPEVKAIYERARENVEEKLASSQPRKDLPKTEDIYRQSAPDNMKHLQSDESIYRPSAPLIDPTKSTIEPEPVMGMNRFVSTILWALILAGAAYFVTQFLL